MYKTNAYSPLRHHGVTKGRKVGIVGLGGLGHMGVKFARAFGRTSSSSRPRLARPKIFRSAIQKLWQRYFGK